MTWFRGRPFKSTAQITRMSNGNLIDSTTNHNQTGKYFAKAAEIID